MRPDARTFRRRRLVAGGGLLAILALLVTLVLSLTGGGSEQPKPDGQAAASRSSGNGEIANPRRGRGEPVPVLMYHGVGGPAPGGSSYLSVEPSTFRKQMGVLARVGAHPVTLDTVHAAWTRERPLPSKPLVITFDDGYRGQVDNALPVLRHHGWPGVLYMTIDNFARGSGGLTLRDVRKLVEADWELGAHTFSHSDLRTLAPSDLRHEVADSRAWLQRRFDVPVNSFAYPRGLYGPSTLEAVRRAGFRTAVTVAPGLALPEEPFELSRVRVSRGMTPSMLLSKLRELGWR